MEKRQAMIISLDTARADAQWRREGPPHVEPPLSADRREAVEKENGNRRSFALAVAAHAALLMIFWFGTLDRRPEGGGGQYLESISIDLVPSQVLESRRPNRPDERSGGSVTELADASGARDRPAEKPRQQETEKSVSKAEEAPKQSPDPVPIAPKPAEQPKTKEPQQVKGTTVTAVVNSNGASAAGAAASPGDSSRYAVRVREALARNRPRGLRHKGTTTIAFAIDKNGKLISARVSESSGEPSIDEAVLAAVRQTVFPQPPAGMTARQLSYVVPFHFK